MIAALAAVALSVDKLLFLATSPSIDANPVKLIDFNLSFGFICSSANHAPKSKISWSFNSPDRTSERPFKKLIAAL